MTGLYFCNFYIVPFFRKNALFLYFNISDVSIYNYLNYFPVFLITVLLFLIFNICIGFLCLNELLNEEFVSTLVGKSVHPYTVEPQLEIIH